MYTEDDMKEGYMPFYPMRDDEDECDEEENEKMNMHHHKHDEHKCMHEMKMYHHDDSDDHMGDMNMMNNINEMDDDDEDVMPMHNMPNQNMPMQGMMNAPCCMPPCMNMSNMQNMEMCGNAMPYMAELEDDDEDDGCKDIDGILKKIEKHHTEIFAVLGAYGMPYNTIKKVVKRIIRLTLKHK
jgi:hypothetical protein